MQVGARQHQARCSAQTGRCKLVCASCSTQVALCKLLCASCSAQVAPASWSLQVAACKLLCANCAPCKLLCASCSVQVALCKLLFVSCSAQVALGKAHCANWSVQVGLRKLLCASCSAQVALKCKLHLATPARGPGRNRTRDPPAREQAREPRDNSRGPVRTTKVAKNLEFLHLDHADSRKGLREHHRNRKKPRVFAPRPRRFPQVARAPQKSQKTSSFCTSTTPIPAEGRASMLKIANNLEFLHLDHADPRRGSRGNFRNHKKPQVFAPRPRRSPQRVARAPQKSQKTSSFCTLTTPIPAEGRFSCSVVGTTPPR